jgi:hypothetical protein
MLIVKLLSGKIASGRDGDELEIMPLLHSVSSAMTAAIQNRRTPKTAKVLIVSAP